MSGRRPKTAQPRIEPLDIAVTPESAVVIFANATGSAILESSAPNETYGRFSIFACHPVATFRYDFADLACPIRSLAEHVDAYPAMDGGNSELPFTGGWIGYLTYEAGLGIEKVPAPHAGRLPVPPAQFNLYDAAAIYDHEQARWYLTAVEWPEPFAGRRPSVRMRLNDLRKQLETASRVEPPAAWPHSPATRPRASMTPDEYFERVARVLRHIEAGDIYQANVTQQFTATTHASPLALYLRLRRANPSSHAAFLPWGRFSILSSSPELFLTLRDGQVLTRPIKGTRPRSEDPAIDAANRRDLIESEKERAELTMIVDLLRNDLGRVCRYGSVKVAEASTIEEHPTVFHQVATINGELETNRNWLDLLLATYPGGSITGAPKIRAMQIISELEPVWRGVYCGSIGSIGLDGSMHLNIAIRTMIQIGDRVSFGAGGAIVADSNPQQEYEELLAKAQGMFRALGCPTSANHSLLTGAR